MTCHNQQRRQQDARSAHSATRAGRAWRCGAAACLLALLGCILAANAAQAFNVYTDHFLNLSARQLALGGAVTAVPGSHSVFSNPAGLANVRKFTLFYNHSSRHFPGSQEGGNREWDQLDGDTEALVVPLPLGTYAHGFTFSGELGYDFSGHPADGSLGYPREHLWGSESIDAVALPGSLPFSAGIAYRRSVQRFDPAPEDQQTPPWLRDGEGMQWGILARVWPGLDYGLSNLKLNYDWTVMSPPAAPDQRRWPTLTSKQLQQRSGWALHPAGWLTLAQDTVSEKYIFDKKTALGITPSPYLGTIHEGNRTVVCTNRGAELQCGNLLRLSRGSYGGLPTSGLGFNFGGMWLNSTEVKGLLPQIVGSGSGFADVRINGFDWAWW